MKIPEQERFFRHVDQGGPEIKGYPELGKCWIWTGAKNKAGHGLFMLEGGKLVSAHRYPYQLRFGPTRQHLWQVCETPACVNPSHQAIGPTPYKLGTLLRMSKQALFAASSQERHRRQNKERGDGEVTHWGHDRSAYIEQVSEYAKLMQNRERQRMFRAQHQSSVVELVATEAQEVYRERLMALKEIIWKVPDGIGKVKLQEEIAWLERMIKSAVVSPSSRQPTPRTPEEKLEKLKSQREELRRRIGSGGKDRDVVEGKMKQLDIRIWDATNEVARKAIEDREKRKQEGKEGKEGKEKGER